eukprot:CAMPEP_0174930198 /NCGR_PEP_ID=MMETSP1355-20121228/30713_1 /TAXON_ID=464990 /ORGANISM="Hemiselmis tepida, Strain CCMP443" /LENGTH=45 /DNA_ID= /DNA_START= /DNA_END= /DNA_ORIENTATION=
MFDLALISAMVPHHAPVGLTDHVHSTASLQQPPPPPPPGSAPPPP